MLYNALIILALGAVPASAQEGVTVTDAWFRALPGRLPAAGYFTIRNGKNHDIAITGARADGCGMLMMHQSSNTGGMNGMDMVDKVVVPAGGTIRFAPGGYHLMCDSPSLKVGGKMPVILNLSDGTAAAAAFAIRNARGK